MQFIVSYNFQFQNDQCPDYSNDLFCPVDKNSVITRSSNKNLKLLFRKIILGIQILSYVRPNTWNSLPNNLKSATSVNSFKYYIKKYFLRKLAKVLPYNFTFFFVSILIFFPMLSICVIFSLLISIYVFSEGTSVERKLYSFFVISLRHSNFYIFIFTCNDNFLYFSYMTKKINLPTYLGDRIWK